MATTAKSGGMTKHLVDMLLGVARVPLPTPAGTTVVVDGKCISDVRQVVIDDDPHEQARLRREVQRAKKRASYERRRQDPDYQAKRAAYDERTRDERRAWKREYDQRTKERQRKQKTDWARRSYPLHAEKRRAATKAYYERNREAILAKLKAKRAAARAAAAEQKL